MSDYQDPDLDLNINLNMDEAKASKAYGLLSSIEKVWNKLSVLPPIDFDQKMKAPKITSSSSQKFGIFSADLETTLRGVAREQESVKKISYSWDSLYNQEIRLLQNKEKQEKTLNLLASSVSEKMKTVPASSSGKYHPLFAQGEGGLIRHSKAVAQGAYALAGMLNVPGDKDRFVVAGLMHDMWKLGPEGKFGFTDPKHGSLAADALNRAGLSDAADLAGPHMGNFSKGQYKNAMKISTFDQRLLNNADWLMSRTYAQDYVNWDDTGNIKDINLKGLRDEAIKRKEVKLEKSGLFTPLVEEQEKAAKDAKKLENSWHSTAASAGILLGILKTIAGLGLSALYIGIKETAAGSQQINAGLGMFTGTTDAEILDNALRESKVWGKPTGGINKAVAALEVKRGNFNLTGVGDLLPSAFIGQTEALFTSNKPMQEIYGTLIDMFTKQLTSTTDQKQRSKLLALVGSNLGPEAAEIVNMQARLGTNWAGLGARTSPAEGFLDWSKKVMEVNAEMQTSINGIKDTWRGLWIEFTSAFGVPFLNFIDYTFRKLGMGLSAEMSNKEAEKNYGSLYSSLTPAQRKKMMQGSLLGKYDQTVESAKDNFLKEMAKAEGVTTEELQNRRIASGKMPYSLLQIRAGSGSINAEMAAIRLAKAKDIAARYGVPVLSSDTFYDIQRKVDEAGLNAVGGKSYGMEIPGINSMPMATAENWHMFNTPSNRKRFPKVFDYMDKFPSLTDTGRLGGSFDTVIQGIMDGLNTGVMTQDQVMTILENYLKSVERIESKDKMSMGNGTQINMNFSLPNGSDPTAIKLGILDAARELPSVIDNAYQAMYAGGYG